MVPPKWVGELPARKSATVVIRAYGVLAGIIDIAVRDRRLPTNPARGVNLPRKAGKERHYLSHAQVQLLADDSRANGTLVLFLAYTGLRWGEAVGLQRRRVLVQANAVKAVQRMLGHASAAMTLDTYADLLDDDLDAVAIALDGAEKSAAPPSNSQARSR